MKWLELTPEQRDAFIAEKVMGLHVLCSGKLTDSYVKVPSRAGGTAFVYWQVTCDICGLVGSYDNEDNIPKEHPPRTDIPSYTTDMNAAWKIVEKMSACMGPQNPGFIWRGPTFKPTGHYLTIPEAGGK